MAGKTKQPNIEEWEKIQDLWFNTGGLVSQTIAAKIFNVTQSHISKHAESMGLEKIGSYITFNSIYRVLKERKANESNNNDDSNHSSSNNA